MNLSENSYVITVNKNKLNRLIDIFNQFNIKIHKIINSFKPKELFLFNTNRHLCCTIGHILCLYSAMIDNLDYCIIYEDDAYPAFNNIHDEFNHVLNDLNDKQWDILILGCSGFMPNVGSLKTILYYKSKFVKEETNKCFKIKTKSITGSQAYIVKKCMYENMICDILKKTNERLKNNDVLGIDKIFANLNCNTYITKIPLFLQLYNEKYIILPKYLKESNCCYGRMELCNIENFKKY